MDATKSPLRLLPILACFTALLWLAACVDGAHKERPSTEKEPAATAEPIGERERPSAEEGPAAATAEPTDEGERPSAEEGPATATAEPAGERERPSTEEPEPATATAEPADEGERPSAEEEPAAAKEETETTTSEAIDEDTCEATSSTEEGNMTATPEITDEMKKRARARRLEVRLKYDPLFRRQPSYHGHGLGNLRDENGEKTETRGIIIRVDEKVDQSTLPPEDRIPDCLEGVPVQVIEAERAHIIPSSWDYEGGTNEEEDNGGD